MTKRQGTSRVLRYEHKSQPLLARRMFLVRLVRHLLLAAGLILISLTIGVLGYHYLAALSWIDALLNASMILGGMGPISELATTSGKLFASFYALYAGIAFLATSAVILAPIAHRVLHRLHLEEGGQAEPDDGPP
jgi:hypothetical protein